MLLVIAVFIVDILLFTLIFVRVVTSVLAVIITYTHDLIRFKVCTIHLFNIR